MAAKTPPKIPCRDCRFKGTIAHLQPLGLMNELSPPIAPDTRQLLEYRVWICPICKQLYAQCVGAAKIQTLEVDVDGADTYPGPNANPGPLTH